MITRNQWGAVPPKWRETFPNSQGVFIHYNGPAVGASVYAGQPDAAQRFLRGIQTFHMGPQRNWPDIAYSFAVDTAGRTYELRGWGVAQAATLDWNWRSHSIFLMLGEGQRATDAQWAGVRSIVAEHNRRYGAGFVKGHRQAPNSTSCPGDLVIADLAAGKGNPQPTPPPPQPSPQEDDIMHMIVKDPRPGRSIWHLAGNTRYRLASPAEVNALRFMGVRYLEVNPSDAGAVEGVLNLLRACKDLGRA